MKEPFPGAGVQAHSTVWCRMPVVRVKARTVRRVAVTGGAAGCRACGGEDPLSEPVYGPEILIVQSSSTDTHYVLAC